MTVVGARPQFIKAAPVSRALAGSDAVDEVIVHTGQHFDPNMSDIFFDELQIPAPAHHLGIHGGSHGAMTGHMLAALETVMQEERPKAVLIYGDTNSTLAGGLAAAKLHLPVFHVEAGLRSFNRHMPEEINRVLIDHVSNLLFCPTETAVRNLAQEGITRGVHRIGDVMQDATLFARKQAKHRRDLLQRIGVQPQGYAICTLHRAENTDDPDRLRALLRFLAEQAQEAPIVWPIHPRTRPLLGRIGGASAALRTIDPLGYFDMHALLAHSTQVFTDSGGLQKEAYFHRVPCVTLRDETEWVETIEAGWNRLWTVSEYRPRKEISDYGDGNAAGAVASIVRGFLT